MGVGGVPAGVPGRGEADEAAEPVHEFGPGGGAGEVDLASDISGRFHIGDSPLGLGTIIQVYILVTSRYVTLPKENFKRGEGGETMAKTRGGQAALRRRHARLTQRLAKVGVVAQGTITEREIVRDDPGHPGQEKRYGPYYQWTCKRHGKTVTVNLAATQANVYQKAIDEHRKLETLLEELRAISLQILDATTTGVVKRKSRK